MSYVAAAYGGFQVWSGFQQADMMRQQASINRRVMEMNAELAEVDSFNAMRDGMTKLARYQTSLDAVRSMQTVAYAARGVDSTFGTAADVITDSETNGLLNRMDLESQAFQAAAGYENQAAKYRIQGGMNYQAEMTRAQATQNASLIQGLYTGISGYNGFDLGSSENPTIGSNSPANPSTRSLSNYPMPFGG